ncbi:MAG: 50S ribosomal protein L35ae [Candidatus Micrarchaeota archaeon]
MKAVISNYRRSRHSQNVLQCVIVVEGVSKKADAEKLVGKPVLWKSPAGKPIKGKISAAHGNKGAVRAIMERGIPGQAVGTQIEIG